MFKEFLPYSKNPRIFEERRRIGRTTHLRRTLHLRSSEPKNEETPSSIFDAEKKEPIIYKLRYPALKIEQLRCLRSSASNNEWRADLDFRTDLQGGRSG